MKEKRPIQSVVENKSDSTPPRDLPDIKCVIEKFSGSDLTLEGRIQIK